MALILHKHATTMHAIRVEIQRSTASAATLSHHYGIPQDRAQVASTGLRREYQNEAENPALHVAHVLGRNRCQQPSAKDVLPLHNCLHAL